MHLCVEQALESHHECRLVGVCRVEVDDLVAVAREEIRMVADVEGGQDRNRHHRSGPRQRPTEAGEETQCQGTEVVRDVGVIQFV